VTALELARIQFAGTASVHFLFSGLTLGLLPIVAFLQTRYGTGRVVKFWAKLYVINYALGIVTGLVMELQFGLTWNGLATAAGAVFTGPLALETLVAFFAESTLLGLWLFGWDRLPRRLHLAIVWALTATAYASAFFVMVANGFQQHPVGYAMRGGTAVLTDFGALLTNPGMTYGLAHLVAGALCAGGFFVAGVSAWRRAREFAPNLRLGLVVAAVGSLGVVGLGFAQLPYLKAAQPAKHAVLTGDTAALARAQEALAARYGPGDYAPPRWITVPQNVMLALTLAMALIAVAGLFFGLAGSRAGRWLLVAAVPLPFAAMVCGWLVREVGRQPWTVYGLLRTRDAVSDAGTGAVAASLVAFGAVYLALAVADWWLLARAVRLGPTGELPFAELSFAEPVVRY